MKEIYQMLFAFKLFRETATCFLWRLWHQATAAALSSTPLAEPWEYSLQPWLIGPRSVSTAQRTSFPSPTSVLAHTRTHTRPDWRDETEATGRKTLIGSLRVSVTWTRVLLRARRIPGVSLQMEEQLPSSRGQPKTNKPYESTKLCKTFIFWPLQTRLMSCGVFLYIIFFVGGGKSQDALGARRQCVSPLIPLRTPQIILQTAFFPLFLFLYSLSF